MNKVNPCAMILSGVLMLRYLGQEAAADLVYNATAAVIREGKTVTYDLGGEAGTSEMADAIVLKMGELRG
jgi:isocitrate dehydrogenase (NAD+)